MCAARGRGDSTAFARSAGGGSAWRGRRSGVGTRECPGVVKLTDLERQRLVCIECGTISDDDAAGWHGYLTLEPDGSALAAPFCPDCSEAEFGES